MTSPATPPDWDSIARFLAGESPDEEAASVRAWLEAHPGDRQLVERLHSATVVESPADVDVEAALAKVHRRMAEAPRPQLTLERGAGRSSRRGYLWIGGLAAAAAAVFFVTTNRGDVASTAQARSYATAVGQRDSVMLPDGSHVILGPQSRLDVPADFGSGARTVALAGDAWFDVKHDASKPFRIRADGALIEDIGTSFAVESDANEGTSVAVVTGSVRLSAQTSGSAPVVLQAGDRGTLSPQGQTRVERNAVRDEDTAWIHGKLAFRDATIARVTAEMERWYGVKIRVADSSLLSRHITTSFEGESVDQALRILGLTMGANVERRGDSVIVSSLRGSTTPR